MAAAGFAATIGSALLGAGVLVQAPPPSGPAGQATFADVYGWVYRTGKEVPVGVAAATCLGLKTPQNVYVRTWLAPDAKIHAVEVGEDRTNPIVVMSVRHSLDEEYAGTYWLADKDGRLTTACNSPHMYASFVAVRDGSLDDEFNSEKAYFLRKFDQRGKWDRYTPVKRQYP